MDNWRPNLIEDPFLYDAPEVAHMFGHGFGEIGELGSAGEYNWGGAAGTRFWIDPQEQLIGVFMVQSIPHRTTLANQFKLLTYQALVD